MRYIVILLLCSIIASTIYLVDSYTNGFNHSSPFAAYSYHRIKLHISVLEGMIGVRYDYLVLRGNELTVYSTNGDVGIVLISHKKLIHCNNTVKTRIDPNTTYILMTIWYSEDSIVTIKTTDKTIQTIVVFFTIILVIVLIVNKMYKQQVFKL